MSVMQAIQKQFQQFYLEKRKVVASITMSDADYNALVAELLPVQDNNVLQYLNDVLGEKKVAEIGLANYLPRNIAKILDYTDGNHVDVRHNDTVEQGTFVLSEA